MKNQNTPKPNFRLKIIYLAILAVLSMSTAKASVLPFDWTGLVTGITVSEKDLGIFSGESKKEGASFYWFKKQVKDNSGTELTCSYAVLSEKPYYVANGFTNCYE